MNELQKELKELVKEQARLVTLTEGQRKELNDMLSIYRCKDDIPEKMIPILEKKLAEKTINLNELHVLSEYIYTIHNRLLGVSK